MGEEINDGQHTEKNAFFAGDDFEDESSYPYAVGDSVLLVLNGESKPVGGIIKEIGKYGELTLTISGLDWHIEPGFVVRSAVTTPNALKGALASVNPSKALGKAYERTKNHLTKAGDV